MINAATLNIKPNHSCILHEIKQYQLLHCVQTVLLSVSLLVFHTEPKTVTAEWCFICSISVDFMWCHVACRRYEDIVKDTLENVLDA